MLCDESSVVRKERRVELPKDASDIETAIFSKRVITVDDKDCEREDGKDRYPAGCWPR